MDWRSIIAAVFGSAAVAAILFGALAWLTKALISQWLARDIERFKGTLVTENGQVRFLLDNLTADALALGRTAGRTRSA